MAEVEFGGVKFRGGKIILILTALSTLCGGAWGAFEVYKDYMTMRTKIATYKAPDLSGFDKRLAILRENMAALEQKADEARDYTKDIKRDLKDELHQMSKQLDAVEKRGKEVFRIVRSSIETNDNKVRTMVTTTSDRFDKRREQLRNDMDDLETRIRTAMKELTDQVNDKIKKALENPLANMRK
jgi:DNA anti-recombination protein RmuC